MKRTWLKVRATEESGGTTEAEPARRIGRSIELCSFIHSFIFWTRAKTHCVCCNLVSLLYARSYVGQRHCAQIEQATLLGAMATSTTGTLYGPKTKVYKQHTIHGHGAAEARFSITY